MKLMYVNTLIIAAIKNTILWYYLNNNSCTLSSYACKDYIGGSSFTLYCKSSLTDSASNDQSNGKECTWDSLTEQDKCWFAIWINYL